MNKTRPQRKFRRLSHAECTRRLGKIIKILREEPEVLPPDVLEYCAPWAIELHNPEFRKALISMVEAFDKFQNIIRDIPPPIMLLIMDSNVPVPLNIHFHKFMDILALYLKRYKKQMEPDNEPDQQQRHN